MYSLFQENMNANLTFAENAIPNLYCVGHGYKTCTFMYNLRLKKISMFMMLKLQTFNRVNNVC